MIINNNNNNSNNNNDNNNCNTSSLKNIFQEYFNLFHFASLLHFLRCIFQTGDKYN